MKNSTDIGTSASELHIAGADCIPKDAMLVSSALSPTPLGPLHLYSSPTMGAPDDDGALVGEEEVATLKAGDRVQYKPTNANVWDAALKSQAKGKGPEYATQGVLTMSPLGLCALEPPEKKGAALRNVTAINANFAIVEASLGNLNNTLERAHRQTMESIGATNERLADLDKTIRVALAAFGKGGSTGGPGALRAVFDDFLGQLGAPSLYQARKARLHNTTSTSGIFGDREESEDDMEVVPPHSVDQSDTSATGNFCDSEDDLEEDVGSSSRRKVDAAAETATQNLIPPIPTPREVAKSAMQEFLAHLEQQKRLSLTGIYPRGLLYVDDAERLAKVHASAARIDPPIGSFLTPAPPAVAIEADPLGAQMAMVEGYVYDILNEGKNGGRYWPELYVPLDTAVLGGRAGAHLREPLGTGPQASGGIKRLREDEADDEGTGYKKLRLSCRAPVHRVTKFEEKA
ncbi:hypothetical protein AURDEDRAFT_165509 [Auricularia subglabra TFB-10046 SS5]|nr:hypothetical protein AURDEDRAFT_165509 [Auricularia subglabra TFB-10046 SS5]